MLECSKGVKTLGLRSSGPGRSQVSEESSHTSDTPPRVDPMPVPTARGPARRPSSESHRRTLPGEVSGKGRSEGTRGPSCRLGNESSRTCQDPLSH